MAEPCLPVSFITTILYWKYIVQEIYMLYLKYEAYWMFTARVRKKAKIERKVKKKKKCYICQRSETKNFMKYDI